MDNQSYILDDNSTDAQTGPSSEVSPPDIAADVSGIPILRRYRRQHLVWARHQRCVTGARWNHFEQERIRYNLSQAILRGEDKAYAYTKTAISTLTSKSFPQFPTLPPELRRIIWDFSLDNTPRGSGLSDRSV